MRDLVAVGVQVAVRTTTLAGVRRRCGYTQSRISWRVSRFPSAGKYTLAWQWATHAMVK